MDVHGGIIGPGGIFAPGYKRPEVLGVLACGTISARPFRATQGVPSTERAGTKVLAVVGCPFS